MGSDYLDNLHAPGRRRSVQLRVAGFTLPELLITVAIVGILASLAGPSFSSLIASQRMRSASTDLYLALAKARSEAIKRNTNVALLPMNGNWNQGWCGGLAGMFTCSTNGVADPDKIFEMNNPISGAVVTGPASVVYQATGRVRGSTPPSFDFSIPNTDATACVTVDLSGLPVQKSSPC